MDNVKSVQIMRGNREMEQNVHKTIVATTKNYLLMEHVKIALMERVLIHHQLKLHVFGVIVWEHNSP